MMITEPSKASLDERQFEFEREKWLAETEIRRQELVTKQQDSGWTSRLSPLVVTLSAGILTLAGTVIAAIIQNQNTLVLEEQKFKSTRELEEQKHQHDLVLKMISVGDMDQARTNIQFLARSGLLTDGALAKKLLDSPVIGVLPSPGDAKVSTAQKPNIDLLNDITPESIELILKFEGLTEAIYTQRNLNRPNAGFFGSGVTIGIGYNISYKTPEQFAVDWGSYLSPDDLEKMSEASGKFGEDANALAVKLNSVEIPWSMALAQFNSVTVPFLIQSVESKLSNTKALPRNCLGALVVLAYNRGANFNTPGDRFSEMRDIARLMSIQDFAEISGKIRSMKRLYQDAALKGTSTRLDLIASLFEKGLADAGLR